MNSDNHVLVIGAGSGIALALVNLLVNDGWQATLVNRTKINQKELLKYPLEQIHHINGIDFSKINESYDKIKIIISGGHFTHVIIAQGFMLDSNYEGSIDILNTFNCNLVSVALILNEILLNTNRLSVMQQVVILGSVAGDRGKEKNPIYDSTKAGVDILCQGFRQRFERFRINLLLIKPGNVNTKMTIRKSKNWSWVNPDYVALDIFNAMKKRRAVVYSPWFWRYIMIVIRLMPERLFVFLGLGKVN